MTLNGIYTRHIVINLNHLSRCTGCDCSIFCSRPSKAVAVALWVAVDLQFIHVRKYQRKQKCNDFLTTYLWHLHQGPCTLQNRVTFLFTRALIYILLFVSVDCWRELHSYKVATVILAVIAGILALFVAVFVGYIFYRRYNNRPW